MGPNIYWQLTRTCDLGCRDCLATADGFRPAAIELSTFEAYKTIDQIATLNPKRFVITGGDPLERTDIFQLVDYARRRGLDPLVAVSPTQELTLESVNALKRDGLNRLLFNLNGASAVRHDALRATPGSFGATLRAMRWAREADMAIEVDTLVTRRNMLDLSAIAEILDQFEIEAWNVYFLVPVADSKDLEIMAAEEAEQIFKTLAGIAATADYKVRSVEAPQYRRYLLQQSAGDVSTWTDFSGYVTTADPLGSAIDDVVFITSDGEVRPSEFLSVSAGSLRYRPLSLIYRASDLFTALRDTSNLKGKCGRCDFRKICGGSRARAWAMNGDMFGTDPLCAYQPPAPEVNV